MDDDDDISRGSLNPAGFTPNYGWPVTSHEKRRGRRTRPTPLRVALGWTLTALLVAGFIALAVWIIRGI